MRLHWLNMMKLTNLLLLPVVIAHLPNLAAEESERSRIEVAMTMALHGVNVRMESMRTKR